MNYFILIASILALGAVFGHFTMGVKLYLKPVLNSNIDEVPKQIMHSLFHYASVFMVLSTIILFTGASQACPLYDYVHNMIKFIALVYAFMAIAQIIIALTSGVKGGLTKMFQWVFWALIALFAILGTL